MIQARLTLSEFVVENTLNDFRDRGHTYRADPRSAYLLPNVDAIRQAFNALSAKMGKELKLDSIQSINKLLHS